LSLAETLDAIRTGAATRMPADKRAIMSHAIVDLASLG
jgi:hypothetical protein